MHTIRVLVWISTGLLISDKLRTKADSNSKPNIVLFLADDLGYGDLGCYGNKKASSPNIDGLAKDGLRFLRVYSEPGDTSARAAILTGRYPVRYGMVRDRNALPILRSPDFHSVAQPGGLNGIDGPLLPSVLKSNGYKQALIGKWNLGVGQDGEHLPVNLGFDLFFGTPVSHGPSCSDNDDHRITDLQMISSFLKRLIPVIIALLITTYIGLVRKPLGIFLLTLNCMAVIIYWSYLSFAIFNPKSCILMENTTILEQPYKDTNMNPRMTKKALEFISTSSENKEPFFLFMSYLQPHHPPVVSPWFTNRSGQGIYYDSVMELDWSVGVIVKKLKDLNIYRKTLIIFASDNGVELTNPLTKAQYPKDEHGSPKYYTGHSYDVVTLRGEKQTVWEGGIRVPAIITWPDVIKSNQQTSKTASFVDLLPTIRAALQSGHSTDDVDGQDLVSSIIGRSGTSPVPLRSLMHYCDTEDVSAVTFKKYKLHFKGCNGEVFNPPLLYDVEKDPGESKPLSGVEDVRKEIRAAVSLHRSTLTKTPSLFAQVLRPWLYLCQNPPFCKKQMVESENFEDLLL